MVGYLTKPGLYSKCFAPPLPLPFQFAVSMPGIYIHYIEASPACISLEKDHSSWRADVLERFASSTQYAKSPWISSQDNSVTNILRLTFVKGSPPAI